MVSLLFFFLSITSLQYNIESDTTTITNPIETNPFNSTDKEDASSVSFDSFLAEFDDMLLPVEIHKSDLKSSLAPNGKDDASTEEVKAGRYRMKNSSILNRYLNPYNTKKMKFSRGRIPGQVIPIGKIDVNENVIAVLYQNNVQYTDHAKNVTITLFDNKGNIIPHKIFNSTGDKSTLITQDYIYNSVSIDEEGWVELKIGKQERTRLSDENTKMISFGRGLTISQPQRFQIETEKPLVWSTKATKIKAAIASTDKA